MLHFFKKTAKSILGISYGIFHKNIDNKGERIDIIYKNGKIDMSQFDIYQKSHYYRYLFAKEFIDNSLICGDFACGTGYGSVMIAEKAKKVIGVDISSLVIKAIKKRYKSIKNIEFIEGNLLRMSDKCRYDVITSFETVEHFEEVDIPVFFDLCYQALKSGGKIIFSTPYQQEKSEIAINLGFHLTFDIDEKKIQSWMNSSGFRIDFYKYQNYQTHKIESELKEKDFIICVAYKK